MGFSYKQSGVDTKKASSYIFSLQKDIVAANKNLPNGKIISNFCGFSGIFEMAAKWKNFAMVATTDGVGTKIHLCNQWNYLHPLGYDLVAMCVNDLYCVGATPIFFLDYVACEKLDRQWYVPVMKSIIDACQQTNMAILGGETAEHPNILPRRTYDLAGFCVGLVHPKKTLPHLNRIKENDCIVAIPSNGFHSNGFSLVRKILSDTTKSTQPIRKVFTDIEWQKKLLAPTRIYKEIPKMLEAIPIKGLCHITGGGIYENLPRILPQNLCAHIEHPLYYTSGIFQIFMPIVSLKEMFSTWNMGMGMLMVLDGNHYPKLQKIFPDAKVIGYVKKQKKGNKAQVHLNGIDFASPSSTRSSYF